jgi:fatty acid metabolism transcriptional regulator FadR
LSFSTIKRAKVSDAVTDAIRGAIFSGDYQPGDQLPAERLLAQQFGVNRSSVREALHRLEACGLVSVRQGGGTRVVDFLATAGLQILPFLLAPEGRLDPRILRELLDLRVELLAWTAERAAHQATPAGIERLQDLLRQLEAAADPDRLQELDYAFFEALVKMSENRVLALLANGVGRVYLEHRQLFAPLYAPAEFALSHHQELLRALQRKDPAAARAAMAAYGRAAFSCSVLAALPHFGEDAS